jgi:RNA polymerase sigma-70 factor (ECF subfamily)
MDGTNDELDLIKRLAAGDEAALGELYDRFARPLYSMVHRILHNPADAEEIVQDVFVSLWKNAETFDGRRSSPFTWLVTIARNKSIDRLRRTQRRLPEAPGSAEPNPATEPVDETLDAAETAGNERAAIVAQWVGELPENQREAVSLAFFDGLTHPQIAERLHASVGTIKSRIRLGIAKLRRKIGGEITE